MEQEVQVKAVEEKQEVSTQEKEAAVTIEVDGGITASNAKKLTDLGADVLVAGSFVFKSANPSTTISELKQITS